ncbi:hypothetical protein Q1695_011391 [Nippostrongylus brasiliensis]|nr:hypothetical protein Q1695_011391 [Nippostrongylus brasiliensis]
MSSEIVGEKTPVISNIIESWYRRRQTPRSKLIMIAGGRSDDFSYLAGVDIFDAYSQQWIPAAPLLSPRCNFGMATVDDSVYAVGGSDPFDTVRSIEIYDSQRNSWRDGPEMLRRRMGLGVTALNETIFAVGGWDGRQISCEVEMLDPRQGEWILLPSMRNNRLFCGVAPVNGHLYATGGEYEGEILNSVEVYDPRAYRWSAAEPMLLEHNLAGATVFCDQLVVVGGCYEDGMGIPHGEMLTGNGWTFLPQMSQPRGGLGVVDVDGSLIAFGGVNGDDHLSSIEYWEYGLTEWEMSHFGMPQNNAYFGITLMP